MNVFNPIFSKNFRYSNLLLTDSALYYRVDPKLPGGMWDRVFITSDEKTICGLLGFELDEILKATKEEFFIMMAKSPMVINKRFETVRKNNKLEFYVEFSEFLKTFKETNKEFTPVSMENFFHIRDEFMDDMSESMLWLTERHVVNSKFNGKTIKGAFPDYDMTKLSDTIPKFKDSFSSKKENELFIIKNGPSEIHKKFLEVTN